MGEDWKLRAVPVSNEPDWKSRATPVGEEEDSGISFFPLLSASQQDRELNVPEEFKNFKPDIGKLANLAYGTSRFGLSKPLGMVESAFGFKPPTEQEMASSQEYASHDPIGGFLAETAGFQANPIMIAANLLTGGLAETAAPAIEGMSLIPRVAAKTALAPSIFGPMGYVMGKAEGQSNEEALNTGMSFVKGSAIPSAIGTVMSEGPRLGAFAKEQIAKRGFVGNPNLERVAKYREPILEEQGNVLAAQREMPPRDLFAEEKIKVKQIEDANNLKAGQKIQEEIYPQIERKIQPQVEELDRSIGRKYGEQANRLVKNNPKTEVDVDGLYKELDRIEKEVVRRNDPETTSFIQKLKTRIGHVVYGEGKNVVVGKARYSVPLDEYYRIMTEIDGIPRDNPVHSYKRFLRGLMKKNMRYDVSSEANIPNANASDPVISSLYDLSNAYHDAKVSVENVYGRVSSSNFEKVLSNFDATHENIGFTKAIMSESEAKLDRLARMIDENPNFVEKLRKISEDTTKLAKEKKFMVDEALRQAEKETLPVKSRMQLIDDAESYSKSFLNSLAGYESSRQGTGKSSLLKGAVKTTMTERARASLILKSKSLANWINQAKEGKLSYNSAWLEKMKGLWEYGASPSAALTNILSDREKTEDFKNRLKEMGGSQ